MARIRYLKPDFFVDDDIKDLPYEARLFYEGLWCYADREGRLEDRPERLKVEIMPYDDIDIEKILILLAKKKRNGNDPFILRYEIKGEKYIQILKWHKHQKPHHSEAPSSIPSPKGEIIINVLPPNNRIRKEIYKRDNYKCAYCDTDLKNEPRKICLDHIVPVSKGGSNGVKNLITACKKCNAKKFDKTPEEVGFIKPKGMGEYIGQRMVNGGLTDANMGNGEGEGNGEGKGNGKISSKEDIYIVLLDFWNSIEERGLATKHELKGEIGKEIKKAIDKLLEKGESIETIKQAITNYFKILSDEKYFFKYVWRLDQFLRQKNAYWVFKQDFDILHNNYLNKKPKESKWF